MSIMAENKEKRYVSDNAQLIAEWDWEKNDEIGLSPNKATCGSKKKHGGSVQVDTVFIKVLARCIKIIVALFVLVTKQ